MKNIFTTLLIVSLFTSCIQRNNDKTVSTTKTYASITDHKDTLFNSSGEDFEYGKSCAYLNKKGDTIIPIGTFESCFSATFSTFAYVYDSTLYGKQMVAINRNKEVIFDAFLFDNGPDYVNEGLFRIQQNGKIGFANTRGQIIVQPIYTCAFPFEDGKAKVATECQFIKDDLEHTTWKSDNWFYIDTTGNSID